MLEQALRTPRRILLYVPTLPFAHFSHNAHLTIEIYHHY